MLEIQNQIKTLLDEKQTLLKDAGILDRVTAIDNEVSTLKNKVGKKIKIQSEVIGFIKDSGVLVTANEFKEHLAKHGRSTKFISGVFQAQMRKGVLKVVKLNNNNKKAYYGLAEWFDGNSPIKEYWSKEYQGELAS
jgi:hypothetical protein